MIDKKFHIVPETILSNLENLVKRLFVYKIAKPSYPIHTHGYKINWADWYTDTKHLEVGHCCKST